MPQEVPGPGWYPDPWFTGQHRYWTGRTWTGDVFADDPSHAADVALRPDAERPPVPPPVVRSTTPVRPPSWSYSAATPAAEPSDAWPAPPAETLSSALPERRSLWQRLSPRQRNAAALVAGLVLGFVVVAKVVGGGGDGRAADSPVVPLPPVTAPSAGPTPTPSVPPPASGDKDASVLQDLVVRQSDVSSTATVQLLPDGNKVSGETTLDLCNGTYPSESLRSARLQVLELVGLGTTALSTEAVLYRTPADAAQAMREIQSVVAKCPPNQPVVSPVGEDTVTTTFGPPPDRSWPTVGGVQRLAYAVRTTGQLGGTDDHIAVYLQRGRVLEGVYFPSPSGAQPPVEGESSIAAIVDLFARRIAALPSSVVNG